MLIIGTKTNLAPPFCANCTCSGRDPETNKPICQGCDDCARPMHWTELDIAQSRAQMSMWTILKSPLLISGMTVHDCILNPSESVSFDVVVPRCRLQAENLHLYRTADLLDVNQTIIDVLANTVSCRFSISSKLRVPSSCSQYLRLLPVKVPKDFVKDCPTLFPSRWVPSKRKEI